MPTPDYFLVQGEKYKSILEKFYNSERIRLLGSLKYDNLNDLIYNRNYIRKKIETLYNPSKKNLILLTPSINDYKDILTMISGLENDEKNLLILKPHPATDLEYIKYQKKNMS